VRRPGGRVKISLWSLIQEKGGWGGGGGGENDPKRLAKQTSGRPDTGRT